MALNKKTKKWLARNCPRSFEGKTVLITGANSGIGLKSAEIAVYLKAKLIMACRNADKASTARISLLKEYPNADIDIISLDISDFSSIDSFVNEIRSNGINIDVFLNNAGVFHKPGGKTANGFELVLGTNYFGVYYLTEKLLPYLESLPHPVTYINTVSIIYKTASIDYGDFFCTGKYNNFTVYGRSKLCLAKYSYSKAKQYEKSNVKILMNHPGISITPLGINAFGSTVGRLAKIFSRIFNSPEKSALSLPFIMANDLPAGSLAGPSRFFGGWGYPENCKLQKRAMAGAEELIKFTENMIEQRKTIG